MSEKATEQLAKEGMGCLRIFAILVIGGVVLFVGTMMLGMCGS